MANPFYTYSGAFIPGTLARAEQVATEYTSVQAGFAVLAIQGTDSGSANTYVVTTTGGPSGSYADGNIVEFKAVNANTGASTLNVNGIGVVNLTSSNGQSLAGGSITANTWYRALYNSTFSAWTIVAPTSLVTTSNTISSSAPTNKVGLTAAGGVSTACVPIDATYAIDQSIVPTWTGAHTFAAAVTFNSSVAFATGLSLAGAANAYALTLTGNSTSGQSKGLLVNAGTNASDFAALIKNQSGGTQFLAVLGEGSVTIGSPTGGGQGVGTINAAGLFINGVSVATTTGANPTASVGLSVVNGAATTFMRSDAAPALSQAIAPTWTAAHVFTPSSAVVAVTVNAAVNTVGLSVVGGTNTGSAHYLVTFATGQGSGFSSGLLLSAGTTSADNAILIQNAAATLTYLQLKGDGSGSIGYNGSASTIVFNAAGAVSIPAPSAGSTLTLIGLNNANTLGVTGGATTGQSFGLSVNAGTNSSDRAAIFRNQSAATTLFLIRGDGVLQGNGGVDMTPDKGTFTGTLTGFSNSPSGTVNYIRMGNFVCLYITADIKGTNTSNATAMTMTGLPAALQPTNPQAPFCANLLDNNNPSGPATGRVTISGGTLTFDRCTASGALVVTPASNWTAGNSTKGILAGWSITYSIA